MNQIVKDLEAPLLKTKDIPHFRPGDTVRVSVRIVEGEKERIQDYQGVVISRKGSGLRETFIVRRVSFGVGMERVFPLHSPRLDKIQVVRRGKVRRAKLYYLRDLRGKKARLTERRVTQDKLQNEAASAQKANFAQIAAAEESKAAFQEELPPEAEPIGEAPAVEAEEKKEE